MPSGSIGLYRNDPEWGKFREIKDIETSGENTISAEATLLSTDYYNLKGVKIATIAPGEKPSGLPAGVYITRRGNKTGRILIQTEP